MNASNLRTATVFGGSGFLGRFVVQELLEAGVAVRVASRRGLRDVPSVDSVRSDVRDDEAVRAAVRGADAVVNVVSLYVERGGTTFQAIHEDGAARVAREARAAGAHRLVHLSGIGADVGSDSPYVRARARGEQRVREAFPEATILRPSVLFGPGDAFLGMLDRITAMSPIVPLFGPGDTLLQTVYAGDVARAVCALIVRPARGAALYELGGPRAWRYREIVELILEHRGRRRWLLPVPLGWWYALARLLSVLPNPPLTRDQLALVRVNNEVHPELPAFEELGIVPRKLESLLPECLP